MKPEETLLCFCVSVHGVTGKKNAIKRNKTRQVEEKKVFCTEAHTHTHFLNGSKRKCPLPFVLFLCYLTPGQSESVPLRDGEMFHFTSWCSIYHFELTLLFPRCICFSFHCWPLKMNIGFDTRSRPVNHAYPGRAHAADLCWCHRGAL